MKAIEQYFHKVLHAVCTMCVTEILTSDHSIAIGALFGDEQCLKFETNLSIVPSISSVSRIPVTAPRIGNLSTVSSPEKKKN